MLWSTNDNNPIQHISRQMKKKCLIRFLMESHTDHLVVVSDARVLPSPKYKGELVNTCRSEMEWPSL